jgi:uncharacterized membrane protein YfcA
MVMEYFFKSGDEHSTAKGAAADLYISIIFVVILAVVSIAMLRDIMKSRKNKEKGPSTKIVDYLNRIKLHPVIYFPVADVRVSLWVILVCGLATGYLAGTIGVGGFVGVPVMIYVFGVSATVAAGSELYLAMFMGAFGAINYAFAGLVDIRLTLLLFTGSLFGIFIGAYGTKVVNEMVIRLVTALIILLCVISRLIAIPAYLQELGYLAISPIHNDLFNLASKFLLYLSGITGVSIILFYVFKAYFQRRKIQASLITDIPQTALREYSEKAL